MHQLSALPRYARDRSYDWNYAHPPEPIELELPEVPGTWNFCGLPVASPLGVPAGPLLNGRWCLYYASLGFDVLTYKTVRSRARTCYPLPNLVPVPNDPLAGSELDDDRPGRSRPLPALPEMQGTWAVSYGMPSQPPEVWREDVRATRAALPAGKLLSVSVVASVEPGWGLRELADDYARCAAWAVASGADVVETNFSCPNVSTCDGQLYQQPDDARCVAERVREAIGDTPFIIKIGHVATRVAAARLLDAVGGPADALAMTNSIASAVEGDGGRLLFDGQQRGICGAAIRDASIHQVRTFSELCADRALQLDLIGVGGAATAGDVHAYLDAGAHAVHIATAAMIDPAVALKIKCGLHARLSQSSVAPDGST